MEVDELQLLRGSSIAVGDFLIKPLTIGEIEKLTEKNYFKYINIIAIDKSIFKIDNEDISLFDLIFASCINQEDFKNMFLQSLKCFLREEIHIYMNNFNFFFFTENKEVCRIITKDNYEEIINVIKLQNCLIKKEEDNEDPASTKAKELLEKQKKLRDKLIKAKGNSDSEHLTLGDLVSILIANGNGINYQNVWDMNFYIFNNQFSRMKMLEEYDVNIRSLLAGAKVEDINLKHWMSKIK